MEAARLTATIDADSKEGEEGLKRFHGLLGDATEGFKGLLATAGGFALGGGILAGIGMIGGFLHDAVTQGAAANEGLAQTQAVLRSTGGAAGVSAGMVDTLATNFMRLTGIQDDTVRSAENMLLTFTNIKDPVFSGATQAVLDMSVALGQDTKNSAIQLGKALNDPIAGVSALRRVGVTFDADQKKLIKTYMDHNEIAKAQGVVLAELSKEFGGSAAAAGQANGGIKILAAQFDNMKQSIGQAVIPILLQLMTAIQPVTQWIGEHMPEAVDKLSALLGPLVHTYLAPLIETAENVATILLGRLHPGIEAVEKAFGGLHLGMGKIPWKDISGAVGNLAATVGDLLSSAIKIVLPIIGQLSTFFRTDVVPIVQQLATVFVTDVLPAVQSFIHFVVTNVLPGVQQLAGFVDTTVVPILHTLADVFAQHVLPAAEQVASTIINQVLPPLEHILAKVLPVLNPLLQVLGFILSTVVGPALSLVGTIVAGLLTSISWLIDKIGDLLGTFGKMKDTIGKGFGGILGGAGKALGFGAEGAVSTSGGPYMVGERGPELILPPRGSQIVPAQQTHAMLQGRGGDTYNIYPAKAQFGPDELDLLLRRRALLGNTGGGY